ncbi:UDP-N-acetylmuramoyl-tripeptide--D-alanyl-D-alanine ligase [Hazenella sp. IB182357]|uniref:UDP-N-acetylmuramoyl-tripeptide--D-alanyl-D-alanine ligase n=1 Tax=Polycladospora coralii TaxID=2771432 RepID=A0A926RSN7_9BACL|nr:UDP-N-acetylmuramoyl-tripeptide--D-alanyl-D-alanine ligase [Polycladospora coralii]MBD1371580.1 UDP-N-acetylmuramoyl-tripeptide--D-alanyl-D-alanine ligase [Polycladospora coralii]
MRTISLETMARLLKGVLKRGYPQKTLNAINFGKPKYLHASQAYFYSRSIDWNKQLSAIMQQKPVAVILPPNIATSYIPKSTAIIQVQDTYQSFWKIALWNWGYVSPIVVGITGSAGKSTTTEMVSSILKHRYNMVKTQGNLNTYSFLPSYLSRLTPKHQVLLLEMGMKSLNNIGKQCAIVKPQYGAITNIGEAHSGSLGGLDLVVKAKQELADGIKAGGILWVNADDTRSRKLNLKRCKGTIKKFGIYNHANIRAHRVRYSAKGMTFDLHVGTQKESMFIPTYGIHNVYNALAACGITLSMGSTLSDIKKGLASFQMPHMRLQFFKDRSGRTLINDAWNANPTAMNAGLDVLKAIAPTQQGVAVLGDMQELGDYTTTAHYLVGKHAAKAGLKQLVTIGKYGRLIATSAIQNGMKKERVFSYYRHDQVIQHLRKLSAQSVVYFKASRSLYLEKIVQALRS